MADNQKFNDIRLINGTDYLLINSENNNYLDAEVFDENKPTKLNSHKENQNPEFYNSDLFDEHHYLMIYPKKVNKDLSRTINTLGFIDSALPQNSNLVDIEKEIDETEKELLSLDEEINNLKDSYKDVINSLSYNLSLREKAIDYEDSIALGEKYFYFSALVAENDLKQMESLEEKYDDTRLVANESKVDKKKKPKKDDNNTNKKNEESYLLVYPEKVKEDVSRSINTMGFVDNEIPDKLNISNIEKENQNPEFDNSDLFDEHHYLMIYPKKVNKDLSRTINTLGFVDSALPQNSNLVDIEKEIDETEKNLLSLDEEINNLKDSYKDVINSLSYNLSLREKAIDYEDSIALGEKYFYFSALVAENDLKQMESLEEKYDDTRLVANESKVDKKKKPKKDNNNTNKKNEESYLLVYPQKVKEDVSRSINTMGFVDNEIPDNVNISNIEKEYIKANDELLSINREIEAINNQYGDVIENLSYSLDHARKSEELKSSMAHGDEYFYLSGWVPASEVSKFKGLEEKYDNTILTTRNDESVDQDPPIRLKNNKVFRPFEFLVNMYGAPNYDEIDPTPFFAITYLLLYGLMFGDLGQGLVFIAIGFWLAKKNKVFGGLIKRIGLSASFFGLMYGSFFGREDIIPALLIKPFDNIMTVLIASVAFGVGLMVISYLIGIYNKVSKQHNIEEGIFGKEGLAGLMMMLSFIIIVLNIVNKSPIPMPVGIIILIASIIMMVFKQPIARKIEGKKRLYDQGKGDYYVESSFSIIEALLSVFSNLVSFTRVGAFAINHVGLYMAFEVMAKLAGGGILGTIILILGNALIIGLEGMIVFIQGLRLEFYEMFSKYYEGNGRLFRPISSKESNN
ncbi:V-type ATPase 116kDa subunit family protein [Anaerococcus sp. ENR1011]|uniref:V-type ATPase 116kDa subunit family protein n=1 Tax=Anaerococcus groningensis TaxID=3115616 RepID=A0ABW9N270_9FIRM